MSSTTSPVRVRIAPSPTGDPHVGTGYVALFNYAFARRHGGQFILRIEDTDQQRSTAESEAAILRSLRWLGLTWDEGPDIGGPCGPYRQSERAAIYREHALLLVNKGEAYRCFCTAARLEQLRQQQREAKGSTGYDGLCMSIPADEAERRAAAGEPCVIRLRMPRTGETVVPDGLRGDVVIPNERSDDQVLLKSDGLPTYHLANVVDDHLMGITHVIRAEEWIPSTPKHLRLYEAFGWTAPRFLHLPLLRNNDKNKSKISKRRNPVSLDYYRDIGILPQTLVNFLALMGWSFGDDREKFTLAEMVERFDITPQTIGLTGPVFDLEKLFWLNSLYLRDLSDEQVVEELINWRLGREYLQKLVPLARERVRRLDDFVPLLSYCFSGDLDFAPLLTQLVPKQRSAEETVAVLDQIAEVLDVQRRWEVAELEAAMRALGDKTGWKTKELFMTLRLVCTGRAASPPLFDTMVAIGREHCRRRVREAARALQQK